MWEKIVLNLVSNAFKFTLEGSITVRLRRRDASAVLEVIDTGTGIAAAELPRIFERFHRVEGAKSRTHEGTGIGLALVQELARLHGGDVKAESTEGRGSTFTVTVPFGTAHLPRERIGAQSTLPTTALGADPFVEEALRWLPGCAAADAEARRGAAPAHRLGGRQRDMRDYVRRLLAGRYDVEAVADGEQALAAARRARPDLILSDVMMPKLDGQQLTRAVRADPSVREVPVMLLSARAGEEARIEALNAGADDYVVKPFSARELLARIDSRLQIARLRSEALAATRESEEALRAADRRKDEFIAMLSHELRNPLAPLRNGLEILRMQHERAVDASRTHDMMERQLGHLVRLVDDLLEMSRINQGTLELRRERVTLASVVTAAVEASEPLIRGAGHRLDVAVPQVPIWLDGDPVRLGQIASNLLNNAAHYTERGGRIWLGAEVRRDRVMLSVRDTGIGFAPEAAAGFFDLFHRGSRSKGLGIGLTIARRLAEMHGGTIRASSEGPGRGACFTLDLPVASAPAAATEQQPVARSRRPPEGPDRGRQRRRGGQSRHAPQDLRSRSADCPLGTGGADNFREIRSRLRPARHRHAGHGRVRGGSRDQKPLRRAPPRPGRVHRLGPRDRPYPGARRRLRSPPRQADGPPHAEDDPGNRPRAPLIVAGTWALMRAQSRTRRQKPFVELSE